VGRGPGDGHIVRLLYPGEKGVDASNHALVCYWLNGPRGKQFDAVIAVGDYVVPGASHWGGWRASGVDPIKGVVHATQFARVACGGKGTYPIWDPRGRDDGSPEAPGVRPLQIGDVYSPACCSVWQGGAVCFFFQKVNLA